MRGSFHEQVRALQRPLKLILALTEKFCGRFLKILEGTSGLRARSGVYMIFFLFLVLSSVYRLLLMMK